MASKPREGAAALPYAETFASKKPFSILTQINVATRCGVEC